MANGPLNRPKLPGIPGINEFKGYTFHTSRWDYDYTGGDSTGNLHKPGRQASSASSAPAPPRCSASRTSASAAKHLYVFQRTPSSVDVRNNRATDPEWVQIARRRAGSSGGWTTSTSSSAAVTRIEDLVKDGWTDIFRNLTGIAAKQASRKLGRRLTPARSARADGAGRLPEDGVDPRPGSRRSSRIPTTAEKLKPWYRQFCKRPCFHDEYLQTFNRPNVTLVDTDGQGRARELTENGVVVGDGVEYEVDCLVFATGFEVGTTYTRRAGYDIIGRDGDDAVREVGRRAAHVARPADATASRTASSSASPRRRSPSACRTALNEQARHVTYMMEEARRRGARTIETTVEAEDSPGSTRCATGRQARNAFYAECTPGYYNNEGKLGNPNGFFAGTYGAGPIKFFQTLEEWRADGQLRGIELH